ncbi:hypothetical protein CK203_039407 [Vitis vinifera]|uniref:Uncharacterized protein n=1 Tax=Vitis vinifera TaxID=29760 RepID=A0A438I7D0_VITVI|nr:hypothetical protein CK203_039407 [Vitis vinifera]
MLVFQSDELVPRGGVAISWRSVKQSCIANSTMEAEGDIVVEKIPSTDNLADPFTETLTGRVFYGHMDNIGALVCMVAHWTGPMVSSGVDLPSIHRLVRLAIKNIQTTSKDDFSRDEWLGLALNPLKAPEWPILGKLFGFHGCLLLDPWMSISYLLRAIGSGSRPVQEITILYAIIPTREEDPESPLLPKEPDPSDLKLQETFSLLVNIETPRETELEVCLNIMDVPPKDQNSQHGQEDNFNAYRSMRDPCIHLLKRMRNSMSVGRGTWKLSMLVLTMALTHGSYFKRMDEPNAREVGRMKSQPNAKGGMYVLNEDIDMKAKVVAMARRLEELEMKKIQEVQAISETPVPITMLHMATPTIQIGGIIQISLGNQSHLSTHNLLKHFRKFPSQPHQNPKGIHELEAQEGKSSKVREVKAVITLRSGKEVDQPTSKPKHDEESVAEKEKREEMKGKRKEKSAMKDDHDSRVDEEPERIVIKEDMMKKHMAPPFPQALHGKKGTNNASEIFEVLRQVKRGLNVNKKALLTEQVSAIIQCKSLVKYKDTGCPTISVSIGGTCVEKALLDLGASVNLLPYSVYKQLGLGKLKPTSITLSLVDRSVKIPRGMIEDVLVQVDKFYYQVDFVVLDTDPVVKGTNYVPIILGRPFLATSNAIINCRNGVMQFTFGNMTLELNIFHLYKKHIHLEEEEGPEEVCMVDTLVEEHCDKRMQEDLIESFGDLEEGLPEPSDLLAALLPWRRREEILPLFNEEEMQRPVKEEPLKLILKPLPIELKYAYLEGNKKCPIVISSALTIHQEDCLLEVLRRCKKAIGWQISDFKGIDHLICTHHIYMEDEAKPVRQPRRRLNPHMQEVVRAEVLKLLQAGIIYPISDSP